MPTTVYLDASFLMLSAKFHIDILSEVEKLLQGRVKFVVPAAVAAELTGLSMSSGGSGRDARIALQLIRKRGIREVSSGDSRDADCTLLQVSELPNVIAATADMKLRKMIRNAGKPVIFLREKAKLELEGIEAGYW